MGAGSLSQFDALLTIGNFRMLLCPSKVGFVIALDGEYAAWNRGFASCPDVRGERELPLVRRAVGAQAAAAATNELIAAGIELIVSFGVAGGLREDLQCGTLVTATSVLWNGQSFATDGPISQLLALRCADTMTVQQGTVVGAEQIVCMAKEKLALGMRFDAVAVDQESGAIAQAANAAGRSSCVLRVVTDVASENLPSGVANWSNAAGRPNYARLVRDIVRTPALCLRLVKLANDFDLALRSLNNVAGVVAGLTAPQRIVACV